MRHPTTTALYRYWNTVRGSRLAPRRYEIEPSQIAPCLSETLILEHPDGEACRIRIAGTKICRLIADDLKGEPFFELWDERDQLVLADTLHTIVRHGAVGLFTFEAPLSQDHEAAEFEMLLLPLTHLGDHVERILGSIAAVRSPLWLGNCQPSHMSLLTNETIWPDGRPRAYITHQALGKAPGHAIPSLRHDSEVRRARLVRSERRSFLVYQGGRDDSE